MASNIEKLLGKIEENTRGGGVGLPAVTSEDNGDVLTVVEGEWTKAAPSGSDLPAVTSDDNGDVLTVVEGEWAKAAPSGGGSDIFVVNFTQDEHGAVSADKTVEEIAAAAEAGKILMAKVYYYFFDSIVPTLDVLASHPDQYYDVHVRFNVIVPASYYDDPPEGDVLHNVLIFYDNIEGWAIEHIDYLMASYGE